MKLISIMLLGMCFQLDCTAQTMFIGSNGTVIISTSIDGDPVSFTSDKAKVILDYYSTKIEFTVDVSTLKKNNTENIFVHKDGNNSSVIRYEGDLNLEFIKTEKHPTLTVIDEGYFVCSNSNARYDVIGNGFLTNIVSSGEKACILSLTYIFSSDIEKCSIIGEDSTSNIRIELIHTVLNERFID